MTSGRYEIITITEWDELRRILNGTRFRSWAFRGQSDAGWPLYSSLSRYLMRTQVHVDVWSQQERRILRIFKRKAHHFLSDPPEEDDAFEWLSIMQHHGSPTRLLDFTWSPYVATFFALESATTTAAIWALFPPGLSKRRFRTTRASQNTDKGELGLWIKGNYERYFLANVHQIVMIGEPDRMNSRLIAQSGTFATPGVLDIPLENVVEPSAVVKIEIDINKVRKAAMIDLYNMNIRHSTLFPDLDGLARSLAYELEFHWAFNPITLEQYPGFHIK